LAAAYSGESWLAVPTSAVDADPFGHNRARPFVQVGDDHVHALRGEPFRDPGAYPVRTPRHQSRQSVEFHVGIVGSGTDIPRSTRRRRRASAAVWWRGGHCDPPLLGWPGY
jgi:hypothetical protein